MRKFNFVFNVCRGFTLVEMLMALLIVSVILSASLPVISQRQKAMAFSYNQNRVFPIGGIIVWYHQTLPDNTWLECNGQSIPSGIEYERARKIFGAKVPNFQGLFLRAAGTQKLPNTMGSGYWSNVSFGTGAVGSLQGDSIREISGHFRAVAMSGNTNLTDVGGAFTIQDLNIYGYGATNTSWSTWGTRNAAFFASRATPTSNEIRPVNIAVKYIAKVRN